MRKYKSPFEHMLCIRSDDHFYELILIYSGKLPEKTEDLLVGRIVKKINFGIGLTMGYLRKSWERNGMLIKHVRIVIPPRGEYLLLKDRLNESFMEQGYTLSVDVGVYIPIPKGDMQNHIETIDSKFRELGEKDYGNN